MAGPLGGFGNVPVRPDAPTRGRLLHRQPAADRQRHPPYRPRLLLHPHRPDRPLPAHARPERVLPGRVGRQRPAHRAPGREPLRRPRRPGAALRSGAPAAPAGRRPGRRGQGPGVTPQLPGALRAAVRGGRAPLRAAVAPAGPLGGLVAAVQHDRRASQAGLAAQLPSAPGAGRGVPGGGADPVGRDLPHRGGPGRAGGPRGPRCRPPDPVRHRGAPGRRGGGDDPAGAAPGVRGPGGPSGRPALPGADRPGRAHAAVRLRGAGAGPPPGQAGQGHRHRHDLHLRRHHGRHLVARAGAAGPLDRDP